MLSLAEAAFSLGVQNFICYSLSTENLRREKDELYHILGLVTKYEKEFIELCKRHRISAKYVGRLELLPKDVLDSLHRTEDVLSEFASEGRVMYIAIAYGSRAEIIDAVNEAVRNGAAVDEESFLGLLSLPCELDLIIRTGGERRLSNFFLYQASYAELYFSDKYFPDFSREDLEEAFLWFSERKRRYGLVK
jgi:undecaprenyl diphosphate synthase